MDNTCQTISFPQGTNVFGYESQQLFQDVKALSSLCLLSLEQLAHEAESTARGTQEPEGVESQDPPCTSAQLQQRRRTGRQGQTYTHLRHTHSVQNPSPTRLTATMTKAFTPTMTNEDTVKKPLPAIAIKNRFDRINGLLYKYLIAYLEDTHSITEDFHDKNLDKLVF